MDDTVVVEAQLAQRSRLSLQDLGVEDQLDALPGRQFCRKVLPAPHITESDQPPVHHRLFKDVITFLNVIFTEYRNHCV